VGGPTARSDPRPSPRSTGCRPPFLPPKRNPMRPSSHRILSRASTSLNRQGSSDKKVDRLAWMLRNILIPLELYLERILIFPPNKMSWLLLLLCVFPHHTTAGSELVACSCLEPSDHSYDVHRSVCLRPPRTQCARAKVLCPRRRGSDITTTCVTISTEDTRTRNCSRIPR
jgi:hypothetical protein